MNLQNPDFPNTRILRRAQPSGWLGGADHILHYDFSETSGVTAANAVGEGHDGTLVGGASFSNGKLVLDGSTGYLSIPSGPDIDTAGPNAKRTVALWFKQDSLAGSQMLYEAGGAEAGMHIYLNQNKYLVCNVWNQNAGTNVSSYLVGAPHLGNDYTAGQWRHVALVLDASPRHLHQGRMKHRKLE